MVREYSLNVPVKIPEPLGVSHCRDNWGEKVQLLPPRSSESREAHRQLNGKKSGLRDMMGKCYDKVSQPI